MALSPFLPATPSSSYHESQSNKLALSRTRSSSSSSSVRGHKQNGHQPPRQQHQPQMRHRKKKKKKKKQPPPPLKPPSSWEQLKNLFTCRIVGLTQVHDPSSAAAAAGTAKNGSKYTKMGSSCTNICTFKDVVHGSNPPVRHRGEHEGYSDGCSAASATLGSEIGLLAARSTSRRKALTTDAGYTATTSASRGGLQLRKLSGCYECHAISEPRRYPTPRTIASCPDCGDVFTRVESLEMHQIIRHAVSELGPEDSGRNIVEIIFKSSWLKKGQSMCKIERILKVHNTQRTITRFEDYRDSVKARAAAVLQLNAAARHGGAGKKNPRCAADGNELLRFHCSGLVCNLGARASSSLCSSSSLSSGTPCGVCTIIRHGFGRAHHEPGKGVRTTASSGRAHDYCPRACGHDPDGAVERRAMLVCRVIAGRIKGVGDDAAGHDESSSSSTAATFDSTATGQRAYSDGAAAGGACPSVEELFVSNPRAILPCFVVIYRVIKT